MKIGSYQKFSLRKKSYDLNFISYLIPVSIRKWVKNSFGILTEADIDVVLDTSGFSYGEQWPLITINNTAKEIIGLERKNKKCIFLPQA